MNEVHPEQWRRVPGRSHAARRLNKLIRQVAPTDASVFLTGESGAGKEVVAQVIHTLSNRAQGPFVALNCGAISPSLIETELFGHERGSFTGAVSNHKGHFERANNGTLFLDEVAEMPVDLQVKLLRVLESGIFMRVGSQSELSSDVRIIAATNRSPRDAVASGVLREDLFYRLQVFPIHVPALRERKSDIRLLAQQFLDELNDSNRTAKRFGAAALQVLTDYSWPGNVRQLRNAVHRGYIVSGDEIEIPGLPDEAQNLPDQIGERGFTVSIGSTIAEVERRLILETLRSVDGSKSRAAKILGVSIKTLYNRLKDYQQDDHQPGPYR